MIALPLLIDLCNLRDVKYKFALLTLRKMSLYQAVLICLQSVVLENSKQR